MKWVSGPELLSVWLDLMSESQQTSPLIRPCPLNIFIFSNESFYYFISRIHSVMIMISIIWTLKWGGRGMMFSATFNNISDISWWWILLVEYPEKTTCLLQMPDKFHQVMAYLWNEWSNSYGHILELNDIVHLNRSILHLAI